MINKILCFFGLHVYEFSGFLPTGREDSFGCPTYYVSSIYVCKHCGTRK